MKEKELHKIIKNVIKGNRKAQQKLYEHCFDNLMRTCIRYKRNRDDAVSLLNEGFLKLLDGLEAYDPNRSFTSWANTIMIRTAIDDFRKNKKYYDATSFVEHDWELEEVSLNQTNLNQIDQLSEDDIEKMVFSLPEMERMVFNLYEGEGFSHAEIALKLQFSERSSIRYLKKAKQKLKDFLEEKVDLKNVM